MGVLKNDLLLAFSGPAGLFSTYKTEALALLIGLKLAKDRNFLPLIIEGKYEKFGSEGRL